MILLLTLLGVCAHNGVYICHQPCFGVTQVVFMIFEMVCLSLEIAYVDGHKIELFLEANLYIQLKN